MSEQTKGDRTIKITLTAAKLWMVSAIILAITLAVLLVYTKPWNQISENPRTINITGEATIKRTPDSFVFNPTYEAETQEAINAKTIEVVNKVKELGLGDAGIQTSISNYPRYGMSGQEEGDVYSAYFTLSVEDKDLAQKIQDYLVTSGATGQISPMVSFTAATKRALRDEATTLAVEDARARAEQTAKNLGVKLGKVIKIQEPDEGYEVYPISSYDATLEKTGASLPINAGESEFPYSVKVEFEIK